MEQHPTRSVDSPRVLAPARRSRRSILRDPVRFERAIGIVLWLAFFAVLLHFGR